MKYDLIDFIQISAGGKTKRTGIPVGKHLAITYMNKHTQEKIQIFGIINGRPVVDIKFPGTDTGIEEAIKVAETLDDVYGDYFDLWQEYPQWNIVSMTRWTVDNGILYWLMFDKVEKQKDTITLEHLNKAWEASQSEAAHWQKYQRPR